MDRRARSAAQGLGTKPSSGESPPAPGGVGGIGPPGREYNKLTDEFNFDPGKS
jgi:hypothetical protein